MNLLIVTPIYPPEAGGPSKYTTELFNRLPKDIKVKVVAFSKLNNSHSRGVVFVNTAGNFLLRQVRLFRSLIMPVYESNVVLILEPLVVGVTSIVLTTIFGKKSIIKFVGDPAWEEERRQNAYSGSLDDYYSGSQHILNWRYWCAFFVLHNSRVIITPSYSLKEFLKQNYGIRDEQINVIYNSVDEMNIKFSQKTNNSVIFVGRLVPWKNVDLVLKSLTKLKTREFSFTIIGDGPEKGKLINLVKQLKLNERVKFKGELSFGSTMAEIAKNEILVLVSDYEGMSHVLLEGMSVGTVIVASNIPGNKEVVNSGKSGFLVEVNDVKELSSRIDELFRNRKMRIEFATEGKKMLEESFTWQVNLSKLLNQIREN